MIISRAPLRITLGGGGTDLPSYYEKYGGFLISGAIDKYIYVGANHQFWHNYSLKYSKIEIAEEIDDIQHPLIKEALKYLNIQKGIEITSLADVPSGTGLGSSGAFLIALLNTLYHFNYLNPSKRTLAQDACHIELDIMKEHEGKQDKYACAEGSLKAYTFHPDGKVSITPLQDEDLLMRELEKKIYIFFTGEKRKIRAADALANQDIKLKQKDMDMTEKMHSIKRIGELTKQAFDNFEIDKFGMLLNEHWKTKISYAPDATTPFIDECYETAMEYGALGGKIMGAATQGAGFFMFYHPEEDKKSWDFVSAMEKKGLKRMPFKFDRKGVILMED